MGLSASVSTRKTAESHHRSLASANAVRMKSAASGMFTWPFLALAKVEGKTRTVAIRKTPALCSGASLEAAAQSAKARAARQVSRHKGSPTRSGSISNGV